MKGFIERLGKSVNGVLSGMDRIIFKGILRPILHPLGAMSFCRSHGILNKNYKAWMLDQTKILYQHAEEISQKQCGEGIIPIATYKIRKEKLAHEQQMSKGIKEGLIGVWSCQEQGMSYRAHFCEQTGYPQLKPYWTRCNHLYYYFVHAEYGFIHVRLQTWFPYGIQVAMNGREWLLRFLEKEGIAYCGSGNKIFHVANFERAQKFLDDELNVRWNDILNGFLPTVFPMMSDILGPHLSYYWTLWQSEWATDILFSSTDALQSIMDSLLRHALMTGTSTRILRYMDRPIRLDGQPYSMLNDDVLTRLRQYGDGMRIRHWVSQNSVKLYNEKNVLRIESTMNNPYMFKVYRHMHGQSPTEEKQRLPLRKGTCDIPLRAQISQDVNNRFMGNLETFRDDTPTKELFNPITRPQKKDGRHIRALDPLGKDRMLLQTFSDPMFQIAGMNNKQLRDKLQSTPWAGKMNDKQLSAKVSRHFRLLRDHGLIKKLPKQNRYMITDKGKQLTMALNALLAASTEELMKLAA
jgi:hypothetical protein